MHNKKRTRPRLDQGLTSLEMVSIGVMVSIVLIVIGSWFSSYSRNSKIAETQVVLDQIFDAEVVYYNNSQPDTPAPKPFKPNMNRKTFLPVPSQPILPTSKQQFANFGQGDWALLNIKFSKPVYFSYSVETSGFGINATFSAIARGDLDGDQHFSRYEMIGRVDPNEQIVGNGLIYSLDPLE